MFPARLDIRSVVTLRSAIDRYHEMREMIDDNDVDRLLILVDWLRNEKLYAEALTEIAHILAAEPGNADAIRLQSLTAQQQELARESARVTVLERHPVGTRDAGAASPASLGLLVPPGPGFPLGDARRRSRARWFFCGS